MSHTDAAVATSRGSKKMLPPFPEHPAELRGL